MFEEKNLDLKNSIYTTPTSERAKRPSSTQSQGYQVCNVESATARPTAGRRPNLALAQSSLSTGTDGSVGQC